MEKGKGLNSIPIRFAVMSAVLTTLCVAAMFYLLGAGAAGMPAPLVVAVAVGAILLPTSVTFLAASKLAGHISALQRSTDAIAAGDFNSPVDVDCVCEVGGLADSFRKMVGRLNSNVVRMNVLAYGDAVTGLPNRTAVMHMLGSMTTAEGTGGAVLFVDLDGFKKVNDTLGHEAGDDLLQQVARRIICEGFGRTPDQLDTCTTPFGELCRRPPEDIVFGRFAGDEFVVLLPGVTDREPAAATARAVLDALEAPFLVHGHTVAASASIGIARTPVDSVHPPELLAFADIAMNAARQSGRSRVASFTPAMRDAVVERSEIEAALATALDSDELTLHYQPKLDARSLECVGVEALVRWNHPWFGLIPPGTFIPIAEQAGLMPALGARIIRMAIRQSRTWRSAGIDWTVAVNVSAIQFENPGLVSEIASMLEEYEVDASLLELEMTESMAMSDFSATGSHLDLLQRLGVRIAIDDFGVGFSNLSQLARLPFNALKIDRSLIADIGRSHKSEAIVKAIVDMAHALGHRTIAEGIETFEQHEFMRRIGCDEVQGFLFAAPMAADALDAWECERSVATMMMPVTRVAS